MLDYQTFLESRRRRASEPLAIEPAVAVEQLRTPTLFVDADILEANLARMQDTLASAGLGLRCHTKTHKCPELARRQLAAGAVGVCCAKVGEAEAMVDLSLIHI